MAEKLSEFELDLIIARTRRELFDNIENLTTHEKKVLQETLDAAYIEKAELNGGNKVLMTHGGHKEYTVERSPSSPLNPRPPPHFEHKAYVHGGHTPFVHRGPEEPEKRDSYGRLPGEF